MFASSQPTRPTTGDSDFFKTKLYNKSMI